MSKHLTPYSRIANGAETMVKAFCSHYCNYKHCQHCDVCKLTKVQAMHISIKQLILMSERGSA